MRVAQVFRPFLMSRTPEPEWLTEAKRRAGVNGWMVQLETGELRGVYDSQEQAMEAARAVMREVSAEESESR